MSWWTVSIIFLIPIHWSIPWKIDGFYIGSVERFVEEGQPFELPFNITVPVNKEDVKIVLGIRNNTYDRFPLTFTSENIVSYKTSRATLNMTGLYSCILPNKHCGFVNIDVGKVPQVPAITCRSLNYSEFTCCFSPDEKQIQADTMLTSRSAKFKFEATYSSGGSWSPVFDQTFNSCIHWPGMFHPLAFWVRVYVSNVLGNRSTERHFQYDEILQMDQPLSPTNLKAESDLHTVTLSWKHKGLPFKPYFFLVECIANYPLFQTKKRNITALMVVLEDWLPHSNVSCSVRARHDPPGSPSSDPSFIYIWTQETVPNSNPFLHPGLIERTEDYFVIYFEPPPHKDRNGILVNFRLRCSTSVSWTNIAGSKRSHKCPWQRNVTETNFQIKSCTQKGCHTNYSSLLVRRVEKSLDYAFLWIERLEEKNVFRFWWRVSCQEANRKLFLIHCQKSLDRCSEVQIELLGVFSNTSGFFDRQVPYIEHQQFAIISTNLEGTQASTLHSWTNGVNYKIPKSYILDELSTNPSCLRSFSCSIGVPYKVKKDIPIQRIILILRTADNNGKKNEINVHCFVEKNVVFKYNWPPLGSNQKYNLYSSFELLNGSFTNLMFVTVINYTVFPLVEVVISVLLVVICIAIIAIIYRKVKKSKEKRRKIWEDIQECSKKLVREPQIFSNGVLPKKSLESRKSSTYSAIPHDTDIEMTNSRNNNNNVTTGYTERPIANGCHYTQRPVSYDSVEMRPIGHGKNYIA